MHFHDLRHTHKTWPIEDGIPEIAQARRLRHRLAGVRGIYSHVTEPMITNLVDALQRRWATTDTTHPDTVVRQLRPVARQVRPRTAVAHTLTGADRAGRGRSSVARHGTRRVTNA
ncbi:hypothetical protein GCM10027452_00440 [Micromonospora halotolerans]